MKKELMKKFTDYLLEEMINDEEITPEELNQLHEIDELEDDVYDDAELMDMMYELVTSLDPDTLDDQQTELLSNIIDIVDSYDDEFDGDDIGESDFEDDEYEDEDGEMSEAPRAIRKRRDRKARRERAKSYRRNKAKIKLKAKKYRKTAKFKKLKRKAKIMSRRGKTATGKRKTKYI